jgi:8-oxo-dGTP pyrophosphatase MutT (NUDIX family)
MLIFHAIGDWSPHQLRVEQVPSTRRKVPQVESAIQQAWEQALARPGIKLFDGPMCRLERWNASPAELHLVLSTTSYREFFGTNMANPQLADQWGREVMANPVGVSPALQTADGFLLMGRRNGSVAYYPNRTHPFAGALEPADNGDLFAAVRRELNEELSLTPDDVPDLRCTGIVEDQSLRQPELIFRAQTRLTRQQIEAQVLDDEHRDSVAIPATADSVSQLLQDFSLTPVGVASLLLWARVTFGDDWFAQASRPFVMNK